MSGNRNTRIEILAAIAERHLAKQSCKLGQLASFKHEIGPNRIVQYVYRSNKMKLAAGISGYKCTSFKLFGESLPNSDLSWQNVNE